ncbi:MAG: ATP-dependent DNA ligase [Armatimonadota bacterium]
MPRVNADDLAQMYDKRGEKDGDATSRQAALPHNNDVATPFRALVEYGNRLAQNRSRLVLRTQVAELLRAVEPNEIAETARLLIGSVAPASSERKLHMSGGAVWRAMEPIFGRPRQELAAYLEGAVDFGTGIRRIFLDLPKQPEACPTPVDPLAIGEVHDTFLRIAAMGGGGSRIEKSILLRGLLCRADPDEAHFIVNNVVGEMRHGVGEGLLLDGIAAAAGIDASLVRRSQMFIGDVGELARLVLLEGAAALERLELSLFTPVRPMLAQTADDVSAAWAKQGGTLALEYKLDGARIQIHIDPTGVRLYTRHLMEITDSLPDVVGAVRGCLRAENAILEGEVVAIDAQGRALPFQELMRRFRRVRDVPRLLREAPVRLYLFDVLYLNGEPLIDQPNAERWARLEGAVRPGGQVSLAPRIVPDTVDEGTRFFNQAVDEGHEGLIAKSLQASYAPGIRGAGWLKIKEALTIDLVVIAAEWGYGRRTGWLSNYHLAARDSVTGELVMVGKTFKGLTDEEFARMTDDLMERRAAVHGQIVTVRPEIVVEVAFNQIQRSPTYPGGLALRFARIVRFRPDKPVEDITTLQALQDIFTMQTGQAWAVAA